MGRNDSAYAIGAFAAGLGVGIALSLLLAPQSGEETREMIAKGARRSREFMSDTVDEVKSQVAGSVKDAKGKLRGAVQAGQDAYRDELAQKRNA
jgi:gas vesicle protein